MSLAVIQPPAQRCAGGIGGYWAALDLIIGNIYLVLASSAQVRVRIFSRGESLPIILVADREDIVGHDRNDRHVFHTGFDIFLSKLETSWVIEIKASELFDDLIYFFVFIAHDVLNTTRSPSGL